MLTLQETLLVRDADVAFGEFEVELVKVSKISFRRSITRMVVEERGGYLVNHFIHIHDLAGLLLASTWAPSEEHCVVKKSNRQKTLLSVRRNADTTMAFAQLLIFCID